MTSVESPLESSASSRPIILCLQGYGQNKRALHERLASLRNKYHNKCEFLISEAPHLLPENDMEGKVKEDLFCWYYYSEDNKWNVDWDRLVGQKEEKELLGLETSIAQVGRCIQDHPLITHILGFSQGGALLSLMCKRDLIPKTIKLAFVGSFYPVLYEQEPSKLLYDTQHVMGEADEIIKKEHSLKLASLFSKSEIIQHKGRHVIPKFKLL